MKSYLILGGFITLLAVLAACGGQETATKATVADTPVPSTTAPTAATALPSSTLPPPTKSPETSSTGNGRNSVGSTTQPPPDLVYVSFPAVGVKLIKLDGFDETAEITVA